MEAIEKRLLSLEEKLSQVISSGNKNIISALQGLNLSIPLSIPVIDGQIETPRPKSPIFPKLVLGLQITAYLIIITGVIYFIYINR